MSIKLLKEMFQKMVLPKDASLIPKYYDKGFILYANGQEMDYRSYLELHESVYQTPIQYNVEYDEETFLEEGDKVSLRMWITTSRPNEPPQEIEVILIAQYKEGKLYRVWELTYPDWSKMPAFENL